VDVVFIVKIVVGFVSEIGVRIRQKIWIVKIKEVVIK
jgi:hypothetical protein